MRARSRPQTLRSARSGALPPFRARHGRGWEARSTVPMTSAAKSGGASSCRALIQTWSALPRPAAASLHAAARWWLWRAQTGRLRAAAACWAMSVNGAAGKSGAQAEGVVDLFAPIRDDAAPQRKQGARARAASAAGGRFQSGGVRQRRRGRCSWRVWCSVCAHPAAGPGMLHCEISGPRYETKPWSLSAWRGCSDRPHRRPLTATRPAAAGPDYLAVLARVCRQGLAGPAQAHLGSVYVAAPALMLDAVEARTITFLLLDNIALASNLPDQHDEDTTLTSKRPESGLLEPCMHAQRAVSGARSRGAKRGPARRRRSWARRRWRRAARARPRPDSPTTASRWAWPSCSRRRPATCAQARPGATASLLSAPEGVQSGSVARLRCAHPGACCAGADATSHAAACQPPAA